MKKFRLIGGGVGLALALTVSTLVAIFGAGGSANAQIVVAPEDAIDPADVTRIHLQVEEDDTCWELAETYLGSGLRCIELVEANPGRLRWTDGEDVGLVEAEFYWLPLNWITPFMESESVDRTHFFVIYVLHGTDLGGINTVDPPATSFVNSDPVRVGNFGGAFQKDIEPRHDCSGWNPSDLMCEGGTRTVVVGLFLITVAGVIFTVVLRRNGSNWPLG